MFTFKNVELKVVTINGKPCARVKEVCKALEYSRSIKHVIKDHSSRENYAHNYDLTKWSAADHLLNWPSDSRKDHYCLIEEGMYELLFSGQQPLAKKLRKRFCNVMFPHIHKQLTNKMVEEHQKAIREREKDAAIALLNDDLENVGKRNRELQNKVERFKERCVAYLQDTRKDNGMVIVQKNNCDEYGYVAICGSQGCVAQKIQNKLADYPNGQLVVLAETPNAIVHYNRLRERGCIIAKTERVRHFKLGQHYTHKQLMELQEV